MSARSDMDRAAAEARAQVTAAREALAASRAARGGAPARNVRQAEEQLHALRGAVADDVRALRDRLTQLDPSARRGATAALAVGAGTLVALVGSGLAVRSRVRRGIAQRSIEKQAVAIARVLAGDALRTGTRATTAGPQRRRGGTALALLAVGAAVAGAALVQRQRVPDDADLWLPEQELG